MPRPKASDEQRLITHRLHKRQFGPAAILRELNDAYARGDLGESEVVVSLRTIKTWISEFRDRDAGLDDPFEWERLEEYGLPWEASSFLLGMWRLVQDLGLMLQLVYDFSPLPPPTVRQARWWWRVHQAVPVVDNELDIYLWAEALVKLELYKDILGKPVDMTGLWAYLAYKPWESVVALEAYTLAWTQGRIKLVPGGFDHFPLWQELRAIRGDGGSVPGGIDPMEPGKLPSVVFKDFLAVHKPLVDKVRAQKKLLMEIEQSELEETE